MANSFPDLLNSASRTCGQEAEAHVSHSHKGAGPVPGSAAGYLPKVAPSQHRQQPEVVHLEPPAGAANTEERPQVKEVIGVKEPAEDRTHCGGSRGSPSAFALGEFLQQDK